MATYEAVITIEAVSDEEARALYDALAVETSSQPSLAVKVGIALQGPRVILHFVSVRRSSLRAALNSFFRLLTALEKVAQELRFPETDRRPAGPHEPGSCTAN